MRHGRNLMVHTFIFGVAVLCLLLAGCKQRETAKPKVALVMKSLANEFFKTMADGARTHQAEHPDQYELAVVGIKNELDVAQQVQFVELMIAQKVDAIVIAPADSKALVAVCKRAMDAGIIVVNIDNKFDESVLADKGVKIPFVGPHNRKGARLAGEYLSRKLKPGDDVAIIEGVPNTFNGIQRKLGFEDAMKAAGMDIVASQSGYWEMEKANQVVSGIITEHPALKAVLCSNDSMALGRWQRLRRRAGPTISFWLASIISQRCRSCSRPERSFAPLISTPINWRYMASSMPLKC